MKITILAATLLLTMPHLSLAAEPCLSPEDSTGLTQACLEITQKSQIYAEKGIQANELRETISGFYGKELIDSPASKKLRGENDVTRGELDEMISTLVLVDPQLLSKNLHRLPCGVVLERKKGITEPFTLFLDFTNLGACSLILNSLRSTDHENFNRYTQSEKREMTTTILNYSFEMFKVGAESLQHAYSSSGYLSKSAQEVNQLASHLLDNDFKEK